MESQVSQKALEPTLIAAEAARAAEAISPHLRPTPARLSENFSEQLGVEVFLKPENFQRTGSFKVRGALYALQKLEPAQLQWGVVTASAGNHAQGVAFAAKQLGVRALVVMPEATPNTKLDAVRALGAETELFGASFDDAYARARSYEEDRGLTMIPPFDHPDVIAGQGTLGIEILEETPDAGHHPRPRWRRRPHLGPRRGGEDPKTRRALDRRGGRGRRCAHALARRRQNRRVENGPDDCGRHRREAKRRTLFSR